MPKQPTDKIWTRPVPGDPTPFIVHQMDLRRKRKEQGLEGDFDLNGLLIHLLILYYPGKALFLQPTQ